MFFLQTTQREHRVGLTDARHLIEFLRQKPLIPAGAADGDFDEIVIATSDKVNL